MFFSCVNTFLSLASVSSPAFTMGRKFVRYRGASPTPYSESESESESHDATRILVKKTVTKEKSSNWSWTRASQASSVSSVTEPARSASPVRVVRRERSRHRHYHRESSRHRHRENSHHHHRRHRSRHDSYHNEHARTLDHPYEQHKRHRRHRRRYSEDAPLPPCVGDKGAGHKRCHCQAKHSLTVEFPPHICPSPILVAVPIKSSRKMEEVGGFTYEEWCKRRECVAIPTETIAPKSSVSNRSTQTQARTQSEVSDQDNAYCYVAMREPGPQDTVVSLVDF
jgi:hypothetical protein